MTVRMQIINNKRTAQLKTFNNKLKYIYTQLLYIHAYRKCNDCI